MKKRFLAATLCVCMGLSLFGCGSKDDKEKEATSTDATAERDDVVDDSKGDLNILDYVELADYKGLELTKEVEEVTEEDIQSAMEETQLLLKTADAVVADGDIAVIDFVGKKDGVAFDGGTAENYELEIGSGSFIDGFEDGLIGVKKGETVDLNLTFPEDYQSTELAGQDVVFTVTVHSIKRVPELSDAWLAANTDYATLADYKEATKQELEETAEETAQQNMIQTALDDVIENSTVKKYYKSLIEDGETQYENYVNTYASYFGQTLDEFLEAQSMTTEDYEETKKSQGEMYAKSAMVIFAIAEDAGLGEEDEGYQKELNELAEAYGMDADTLKSAYGEELVNISVMPQYVMNYMIENSNVTTKTVTEEETTTA